MYQLAYRSRARRKISFDAATRELNLKPANKIANVMKCRARIGQAEEDRHEVCTRVKKGKVEVVDE